MDKLRILPLAFACGLVLSAPALAQLQTLAPGTPGITEFEVTLKVTGASIPLAFPQFTPIHPLQSAGGGSDFFFFAATGRGCFGGCDPYPYGPDTVIPSDVFSMFDVTFQTPVNKVVALGMTVWDCDTACSGAQILAFDGQQLVASGGAFGPDVCSPTTGFCTVNATVSAPVITSVWISGTQDLPSSPTTRS